jgi:hypothetical protein
VCYICANDYRDRITFLITKNKNTMAEQIKGTFFMLHVQGQSCPTHKHETIEDALIEAEKLMNKTQKVVYVLQGIKALEPKMDFNEIDLTDKL